MLQEQPVDVRSTTFSQSMPSYGDLTISTSPFGIVEEIILYLLTVIALQFRIPRNRRYVSG
jgi:hypothetical protein